MAVTIQTTDLTTVGVSFTLATAEDVYIVAPDVLVVSTLSSAIHGTATDVAIVIDGNVASGGLGNGVQVAGDSRVAIGSRGTLLSAAFAGNAALFLAGGGGNALDNAGEIRTAFGIGVLAEGGSNQIVNTGSISGGSGGVFLGLNGGTGDSLINHGSIASLDVAGNDSRLGNGVFSEGNNTRIVNYGDITGTGPQNSGIRIGNGSAGSGDGSTIVNFGTVSADRAAAIDLRSVDANETVFVRNFGLVAGDILGGAAGDIIVNRGTVAGNVTLGDGGNLFDGIGGAVTGVVQGGAGNDTYRVSDPLANLADTSGVDIVQSLVTWSLSAAFENLTLLGAGDIDGTGTSSANTVAGNLGDNRLSGLDGDDSLVGQGGDDVVDGGNGNDAGSGGNGGDFVLGRDGNDTVSGNTGDDRLFGGEGDDRLNGGDGEDRLTGGLGADTLTGGTNADVFVFLAANETPPAATARDTITDFVQRRDLIDLAAIDANTGAGGDQRFSVIGAAGFSGSAGELRSVVAGTRTRVEGDVDGDGSADFAILVNGTLGLTAGDFVL